MLAADVMLCIRASCSFFRLQRSQALVVIEQIWWELAGFHESDSHPHPTCCHRHEVQPTNAINTCNLQLHRSLDLAKMSAQLEAQDYNRSGILLLDASQAWTGMIQMPRCSPSQTAHTF